MLGVFGKSKPKILSVSEEYIHKLSHQKIHAKFWEVEVESLNLDWFQIIDRTDLKKYPVSALIQKYLVAYNFE